MKPTNRSARPTVSLCMIVKNEEAYLEWCLKSVEDVVDEIVIVDTGSSDRTLEIARRFNAKIHHWRWADDFAAARNASLRHATGEWILHLDADERLLPESKAELLRCLKDPGVTCYSVLIDSPAEQLKKGHISRAHRLFRNLSGIRYSGRIHEQISPSVAKLKRKAEVSNIKFLHLGYAKNAEEMQQKSDRNFKLLKQQITDEPNHAYWRYLMAQNLILSGNNQDALVELETALKIGKLPADIQCSIFNNLAEVHMRLGDYPLAVEFAEKALAISKNQLTSYLLLNEIYGYLKDNLRQIDCLESAVQLIEKTALQPHEVALDSYVDPAALYLNLGHRYLQQKRTGDAAKSYQMALRFDAENVSALRGLADSLIEQQELQQAAEILERLLALVPDDRIALEKQGWIAIKQQQFNLAITHYAELLHRLPGDTNIQRRLAALYYKIGDVKKSKACLLKSRAMSAQ
ncbi:MAG TPA: glycosyltransferase [bacterium]